MDSDQFLEMNGGDDEDEALRRAIALSMQGAADSEVAAPEQAKDGQGYIDLTSSPPTEPVRVQKKEETTAPPAASSMMGLDRKRMEEERLARLQKRKAADSSVADAAPQPPAKRPAPSGDRAHDRVYRPSLSETTNKAEAARTSREPPETHRLDDQRERPETQKSRPSIAIATAKSGDEALPFPQGIVKKTWAYGVPRNGDDIKIEEVLRAKDLELAVLSSFQWDEEWLMSKLNMRKTKLVLVAYAGDDNQLNSVRPSTLQLETAGHSPTDLHLQKAEMRANVPSSIRFCFPPMHGGTCMHSKLQLLKYPTYLRVVVPTGNLVPYDWGETGVMENMVFIIDLPRIKDADKRNGDHLTPFGEELAYFLNAQGLDESLVHSLRNYDFSETKRYGFVHTIAGSHYDGAWQRTGYCGLGRTVNTLGLQTSGPVSIDFICSSVGSLKMDLLTALYNACQGDSGMAEYQSRTNKSKKAKSTTSSDDRPSLVKSRMRIYFPSLSTVENSRGGKGAAGTIHFQSKWWNAPTFPREVLRDLENVRKGLLMHSKIMFVRPESKPEASWVYVGSANMSESAWGRLVKEQGSGRPKLNCRNWECGVLLPTTASNSSSLANASVPDEGASMLDIFREVVPIPVKLPGTAYQEDGGRRPWFSHDWQ